MEWFKHFTSAHETEAMVEIMNTHGHKGYAVYYMVLELCQRQLTKQQHLRPEDCVFRFHERILREKLRLSRAKVEAILNQCATLALLSCSKVENVFEIGIPNLLELLNRDARLARQCRASAAPAARLEREREKEKEPPHKKTAAPQAVPAGVGFLLQKYQGEFKSRYGGEAAITGQMAAQLKTLLKSFTPERLAELVGAYFEMEEFTPRCHDLTMFGIQVNKVALYHDRGQTAEPDWPQEVDYFAKCMHCEWAPGTAQAHMDWRYLACEAWGGWGPARAATHDAKWREKAHLALKRAFRDQGRVLAMVSN